MSSVVLSIASRQSREVQSRAVAAVCLQRHRELERTKLERITGVSGYADQGANLPPTLDAWYRAKPLPPGRIRLRMTLPREVARLYGLPATARLIDLRDMATATDHWSVAVLPTMGGHIVGVAAPDGSGVGVVWRLARKANDYALRLSAEHGLPIRTVQL
ncbi:hypothetical protein [Sphingomonas sp. S-NIH.Pt15_0812]|uniref:hypothetical protein n=1 Tax=Sphingomonas sp. S-NIH.Pt15_0812 TaxID=1920129 RepID=UPI000F7F50DC|nr:hypothetical protein [Sphingomonas sp. S-NIH.Pt15_0812]RSU54393.1 hypothetical protein BRX43_02450 [Sphingomonas sp. S-NIH.Pt15_0812]